MTEHKFAELLGSIDPALVARAEQSVPAVKKPSIRRFVAIVAAAALTLTLLSALLLIPFIPKTLELDYATSPENGQEIFFEDRNVWIWYTDQNGRQKREYVRLPGDVHNVFVSWAYLNELDDNAALIDVTFPDETAPAGSGIDVVLSCALRDHPDSEALLASLIKTLAHFYDVPEQSLNLLFKDPCMLEFSHDLPAFPTRISKGEELQITITMKNVSDYVLEFTGLEADFVPLARLRTNSTIYVESVILPDSVGDSQQIGEYRLAPGQSKSVTYVFDLSMAPATDTLDLIISFGDYSQTFENAVQIVSFSDEDPNQCTNQFLQFLQTYGFFTADVSEFKAAIEKLSYQGTGIFEIMIPSPVDFAEGYEGEEYASELFAYSYLRNTSQPTAVICTNHFYAQALPDGLTLPLGITAETSLQDALGKMGFDWQTARVQVAQSRIVLLAFGTTGSLSLEHRTETGQYLITYRYTGQHLSSSTANHTQSFDLLLSYTSDGKFESFSVNSEEKLSTATLARYTNYAGYEVNWPFTIEQSIWLQDVLNTAEWTDGLPLYTDYRFEPMIKIGSTYVYYTEGYFVSKNRHFEATAEQKAVMSQIRNSFPFFLNGPITYWEPDKWELTDAEPFMQGFENDDVAHMLIILNRSEWNTTSVPLKTQFSIVIGGQSCGYHPSSGIFTVGEHYTFLSDADQQFVNAIITRSIYSPQFSSVALGGADADVSLPPSVAQCILQALSEDRWYSANGMDAVVMQMQFDCNGTTVYYANGTFFAHDQFMYADSYTRDCMDALYQAILHLRSSRYDAVLYFEGEYYGHNAQVDRTHQDTALPGGVTIQTSSIAHVLAGDDALPASSLLILGDHSHTILYSDANGGTYFEPFTSIDPSFDAGEARLIHTEFQDPRRVLSEKEAQTLRDILDNAAFFCPSVYLETDDIKSYSHFIVNGYEIFYISKDRLVTIGDWSATLSEQDAQAIDNVIFSFIAIG